MKVREVIEKLYEREDDIKNIVVIIIGNNNGITMLSNDFDELSDVTERGFLMSLEHDKSRGK